MYEILYYKFLRYIGSHFVFTIDNDTEFNRCALKDTQLPKSIDDFSFVKSKKYSSQQTNI